MGNFLSAKELEDAVESKNQHTRINSNSKKQTLESKNLESKNDSLDIQQNDIPISLFLNASSPERDSLAIFHWLNNIRYDIEEVGEYKNIYSHPNMNTKPSFLIKTQNIVLLEEIQLVEFILPYYDFHHSLWNKVNNYYHINSFSSSWATTDEPHNKIIRWSVNLNHIHINLLKYLRDKDNKDKKEKEKEKENIIIKVIIDKISVSNITNSSKISCYFSLNE